MCDGRGCKFRSFKFTKVFFTTLNTQKPQKHLKRSEEHIAQTCLWRKEVS